MFDKKICKRCGKKINRSDNFCSNCGFPVKKQNRPDWGMLGKNDLDEEFDAFSNSLFGKMGSGIMGKMINSTMKMLEKEMQKEAKNSEQNKNKIPRTNFRLMINGKEINLNDRNVAEKKQEEEVKLNEFTEEQVLKFSKLKKIEPKTSLKRIGDKIFYEIEMPDVKSIKDISIRKLENGIEIKAIAKNKAYVKRISLNLPIFRYDFSDNLLVLEFKGN